jgi:hypothetical protein
MAEFDADVPPSPTINQGPQYLNADDSTQIGGGGVGAVVTYRMRGYDQNVSVDRIVYWNATEPDADASEYTGSVGPVVDIVVVNVISG